MARTVHAEVPPLEYELTAVGQELIPVCLQLHAWGARHKLLYLGAESTLPQ